VSRAARSANESGGSMTPARSGADAPPPTAPIRPRGSSPARSAGRAEGRQRPDNDQAPRFQPAQAIPVFTRRGQHLWPPATAYAAASGSRSREASCREHRPARGDKGGAGEQAKRDRGPLDGTFSGIGFQPGVPVRAVGLDYARNASSGAADPRAVDGGFSGGS
jgi:hypothetical protein